jgi:uncharacterized protein (TIGR02996 family)
VTPGNLLGRMTGGRGGDAHAARSACSRLFRQGKASAREVGPEAVADAGFVAAILRDPFDDAPRMAYADWLTERDDPRGEFVAAQLELARGADSCPCPVKRAGGANDADRPQPCLRCAWCRLNLRAFMLLNQGAERWFTLDGWVPRQTGNGFVEYWAQGEDFLAPGKALIRRGFVAHVTLTLADFLAHAAALLGAAPLESVRLADWWWIADVGYTQDERHLLPLHLYCQGHWPSRSGAERAVSDKCVAHGRRLAGLPALPAKEAARE